MENARLLISALLLFFVTTNNVVWSEAQADEIVVPAEWVQKCSRLYQGRQRERCINSYQADENSTQTSGREVSQSSQRKPSDGTSRLAQQECMRLPKRQLRGCLAEVKKEMMERRRSRQSKMAASHSSRQSRRENNRDDNDHRRRQNRYRRKRTRVTHRSRNSSLTKKVNTQPQTGFTGAMPGISLGMTPDGNTNLIINGNDKSGTTGIKIQVGVKRKTSGKGKNIFVDISRLQKNCAEQSNNCLKKKARIIIYP